jgi:hypothetical protein
MINVGLHRLLNGWIASKKDQCEDDGVNIGFMAGEEKNEDITQDSVWRENYLGIFLAWFASLNDQV